MDVDNAFFFPGPGSFRNYTWQIFNVGGGVIRIKKEMNE